MIMPDLKKKAAEIRDERDPRENTAQRVGECLVDMAGAIESLKTAAAGGFAEIFSEVSETEFISTFSDAAETVEKEMRIPASTKEKAGMMTAKDKQNLEGAIADIEIIPAADHYEVNVEEVSGKSTTATISAASNTSAGVMTAQDKQHLDNAITGVNFQERPDQIAVQYVYPSGPGGADAVFPMASAENAGAMSADDKQTVETLKRRMSEIVTNARTEARGGNVYLLLDKLGSAQAAPVSLPVATTERAGVMTAKDKKKVEKPYKKLVVGRAISLKARKGMRYFFADGKVKIRFVGSNLAEFENIKNILAGQGMSEHNYGDENEGFFLIDKRTGTDEEKKNQSVIATITGVPPITLDKIKVKQVNKEVFTCLETASPFLMVRGGKVIRNCPIGMEEAISAFRKQYKTPPDKSPGRPRKIQPTGYLIKRYVRATLNHKNAAKRKAKVWKIVRTTKAFHGARVKVWRKHRGKRCPNFVELYVYIGRGKKKGLNIRPI